MFFNFLYSINMVVLTIIAPSSQHTFYFKEPLSNPSYICLLSASLYNSSYNLKKRGEISIQPLTIFA